MTCPECKRYQRCGCNSCYKRVNQPMLRRFKFVRGDFIKCAYCRKTLHGEIWENYGYEKFNQLTKSKNNK